MSCVNTLKKIISRTRVGDDFYILLGDFLDEFYHSDDLTRQHMICECPDESDVQAQQIHSAYVAATAHKLANDFQLPIPEWVFKKSFYAGKPFFDGNVKGNLRWWFMYNSPSEFKHRNLFVCENVLERV